MAVNIFILHTQLGLRPARSERRTVFGKFADDIIQLVVIECIVQRILFGRVNRVIAHFLQFGIFFTDLLFGHIFKLQRVDTQFVGSVLIQLVLHVNSRNIGTGLDLIESEVIGLFRNGTDYLVVLAVFLDDRHCQSLSLNSGLDIVVGKLFSSLHPYGCDSFCRFKIVGLVVSGNSGDLARESSYWTENRSFACQPQIISACHLKDGFFQCHAFVVFGDSLSIFGMSERANG
ncbi:MAG: hypothetical protein BWZ04_01720 [Firmicutes bacterium ADurb.BinA205]|nr:MAG: hypothetical protein BWZ04_01720 [Firmicutes bacterium ADurb.BinA205]